MPHIVLACLDALMGNATNGRLHDLRAATAALKLLVDSSDDPPEGSVELLESIETWACTGGTYEMGAADQAKTFTDDCNKFL